MLIYIFAEHYPNPYKPQFDTEFAYFIRQGHEIRIFVSGQYCSTLHPRVREYGLDKLTSCFPTTLKTLPGFLGPMVRRFFGSPLQYLKRSAAIFDSRQSLKINLLKMARMLMLPLAPPDLCYIHNLATASMVDFLPHIYPASRVFMYFHGGEVGGVSRVAREKELFSRMRVVLTNTDFSRKQAIRRGAPDERTVVAPVCFDMADYPDVAHKKYRESGLLHLISIGRLSEEKGLLHSLEAIRSLVDEGVRNFVYTIVGRGMQEQELKKYVQTHSLGDFVKFAGELDKSQVVDCLRRSDVLVLPSLVTETWAETQAAVVQEAMLMRVLVIATEAGGVPESTAPALRQFSVPVGDSWAIAEKIKQIMALPEVEVCLLGEEARRFAVDRYDINLNGHKYLEYVADCL